MVETQRLYVSPLDPELLPVVLPGPLSYLASNISYHALQSFPEKRYGYFDLSIPEADRLQKKLHGSILKGVKMKVEKARPEKARARSEGCHDEATTEKDQKRERKAKSEKEDLVMMGVELSDGRKIKRGWTEPGAGGKKSTKRDRKEQSSAAKKPSAHTDGPECLFKTKLPRNVGGNPSDESSEVSKSKKRKRGDSERDVVVHEFDKTTKQATFLREDIDLSGKMSTSSYAEGKGWLDQSGNVLERVDKSRMIRQKARGRVENTNDIKTRARRSNKSGAGNKPGPASNDVSKPHGKEAIVSTTGQSSQLDETGDGTREDQTSSEGSDSSETDEEVDTDRVRALSVSRLSPTPRLEDDREVHLLEALFKLPGSAASQTPRKPTLEVKTGFTFFEPDEELAGSNNITVPQTPFTQQDFQERRHRSAAPTPDTAAPGKTSFGRLWSQGSRGRDSVSDEEQEGDATSTPIASSAPAQEVEGDAEESEFAKWFYEHRGETNRAWKKRRREAAKEKRQKENKRH
ncbi:MAG: hypothetical protein Q9209_006383 [Squamulea sp. 1 TL-2023]